jgi:plastocyanin
MKKTILLLIIGLYGTTGFSVTHVITNSGFTFTPASLTITLGDSVNFDLGNTHNAVEVSETTWNANSNASLPGFSTGMGGGLVLPAQLTVGTHYYVCTPHASMGMKGVIIVENPTEIKDNPLKASISIYPNPSKGKFQLDIESSQNVKDCNLEIFNLMGVGMYTLSHLEKQDSYNIDLSGLPKGIYLVKISYGTQFYYRRILLE